MSESDFELVEGSGNVFRDLGDPHADLKQAKAVLAARIIALLDKRSLSVRKAAELTRFAAADFSRIRNADLGRFTLDRLMKMLAALDGSLRVTLHVAERRGEIEIPPHISTFWNAVARNAVHLETSAVQESKTGTPVEGLSETPLWPDSVPIWASRLWSDFKDDLPDEEGRNVWVDWYEARLAGQSGNEGLEFARVTIAKEDMEKGPTHVNAMIDGLIKDQTHSMTFAVAHGFEQLEETREIIDLVSHAARLRHALPDDPFQVIGTTKEMILVANRLRDRAGTGHGRVVGEEPTVTATDAGLVASMGMILAAWLLRHGDQA